LIYRHKEKIRLIFDQRLTRQQGEVELNQWIKQAKKMKNKLGKRARADTGIPAKQEAGCNNKEDWQQIIRKQAEEFAQRQ
jgi:hypothetical protein